MDLIAIAQIIVSSEATLSFLRNKRLLKSNFVCCGQTCAINKIQTSDGESFRCRICRRKHSIRGDSIFAASKLQLVHLVILLYLFAQGCGVTMAHHFLPQVSQNSIVQWFSYFREVMSSYLLSNPVMLGNRVDAIVEMDETFFTGTRKYHRGALRKKSKTVFGIIDRKTQKCVIRLVPDKSHASLLPIIESCTVDAATVFTDEAPMYKCLSHLGFDHKSVCHKREFKTPDGVHTNTIEGLWSNLKSGFKKMHGTKDTCMALHIDEFVYRWNRKKEGDIFDLLIADIATQYPV